MKKTISTLLLAIGFVALAVSAQAKDSKSTGKVLVLPEKIPYGENISQKVKNECNLDGKLSQFLKANGQKYFTEVKTGKSAPGDYVLNVEIYDADNRGGGAWSGSKFVTLKGQVKQNGKVLGTFTARRYTGGGAFAGFKGTCSLLGRCVKTLASDIANWAQSPTKEARLGDS